MDDRDLHLLRSFRADEVEPPAGLQERIEERLWQSILDEERRKAVAGAAASRSRRRWSTMLRPALAVSAAVALVGGVAIVSDGGRTGTPQVSGGGVTQASGGLLDGTARAMFGTDAGPVVGRINLAHEGESVMTDGPRHDSTGDLDERSTAVADALTRDPEGLRDELRSSIATIGRDDRYDSLAFRTAIVWIVDPAVPTDLRAAMLRSLGGLDGIDDARTGADMLGRPGVILGHDDAGSGIRTQVVLNAETGTLRELRSFTTTYLDPACPPGTFTEYDAYDDDGEWIDPGSQPFVDWPQVVAACDHAPG